MAAYFSKLHKSSETANAFFGKGDPTLSTSHPVNTFKSPFAQERTKSSWYFKSAIKVPAVRVDDNRLEFKITGPNNPDALLESKLIIRGVKGKEVLTKSVDVDASLDWNTTTIQRFDSSESSEIERSLRPGKTNEPDRETVITHPWCYTASYNRYFPLWRLDKNGKSAVSHSYRFFSNEKRKFCCMFREKLEENFEVSVTSGTGEICCNAYTFFELWVTVAWMNDGEKESVLREAEMAESAVSKKILSPIVTSSLCVSQISPPSKTETMFYESPVNPGHHRICQQASLNVPGCFIYAFVWKGGHGREYSISSGEQSIFDTVPDEFFGKPSDDGTRIWKVSTDSETQIWPPPGVGLASSKYFSPGGSTFTFKSFDEMSPSLHENSLEMTELLDSQIERNSETDFRVARLIFLVWKKDETGVYIPKFE